jgi:predicted sulfurtransferase
MSTHCEMVEMRHLGDAIGDVCIRAEAHKCEDCGASLCAAHTDTCSSCGGHFCSVCLRFHVRELHKKPNTSERSGHKRKHSA